jgi:Na+/proline symporter
VILGLGIATLITNVHTFSNIAGFISAIGFMAVFFKDHPENEDESAKRMRKNWYIVFATGIVFSLVLGSFWNTHMGNMEIR